MDPTERHPWSDLPPEILSMIGMRLDTCMDVIRFRGVCSSFRSSITPPCRQAAPLPLRNPSPQRPAVFLCASTVCPLETPEGGANSGHAQWLLKLEEAEPGCMWILSLFSQQKIAYLLPESRGYSILSNSDFSTIPARMDPPSSELPPEILSMIAMRLDTRMDVVRFGSVCSSFRSSIPPLRHEAALLPLRIPSPQRPAVFLRASTVCALETPEGGATSGRARWLLKLEESEPGRMRILSLFSQQRIAYLPREFPMVLDSLQFRIVEICRQYTLDDGRGTGGLFRDVQKVVMHPDSVWSDLAQCLVYFIDEEGQLGYWKYGDENWSYLDDPQDWGYDDIVVYEGKVCVVDELGSVWQIDSSFRLQSFSLPIYGANRRRGRGGSYWKHLVASSGDLYVVDRYVRHGADVRDPMYTENMRVYRLDRRFGGRWEEVSSLGNSAFFLCKHCSFAVPACELGGLDGNCIYYAEESYSCFSREDVKAFSLADGSIRLLGFSDALLDMTPRHRRAPPRLE